MWKLILGLHAPTNSHNMSKYHQYENHIANFVVASPLHISFLHFFKSSYLHLHSLVCILWFLHILHSHYLIFLSLLHCCLNFAPSLLCIFTICFLFLCWFQTKFSCKLVISLFHQGFQGFWWLKTMMNIGLKTSWWPRINYLHC